MQEIYILAVMIISFNAKFDVNDIDHIYMVRQKPEVQLLVYMIIKQSCIQLKAIEEGKS